MMQLERQADNRVFTGKVKHVYVAGDLHGDYKSYRKIIDIYKKKPVKDSLLLFLGDYADRGSNGLEIIMELNKLLDSRKNIIALKGNHEMYKNGEPTFFPCDLRYEAEAKYGSWKKFYQDIMMDFIAKLHIAAVVNNILFIHAGIYLGIKSLKDLEEEENEVNLLWSDPSSLSGEHPNLRGAGITFGEDITTKVLSTLGLEMIVRSHEPHKAAYEPCVEHSGKVITINSCDSYGKAWKPFILEIDTESLKYETVYLQPKKEAR